MEPTQLWNGLVVLGASRPAADAIDRLLACHDRIRGFMRLAESIANTGREVGPDSVALGARALVRYFTVALPLHVADEDLSLAPRLLRLDLTSEVRETLALLTHEHAAIEAELQPLTRIWNNIAGRPRDIELRRSTLEALQRFELLMSAHLVLEEKVLFPAARRLLAGNGRAQRAQRAELAELGGLAEVEQEMRERRVEAPR
jgi:iron-sulfur cluster repair protein YtfE (RIC family)